MFKKINYTIILSIILLGCSAKSELIEDSSTDMNGSFEVVRSGLPVNWMVYSPKTVSDSDFKISFDRNDFKHGIQSILFDIKNCSDEGGYYSPGLAKEFDAKERTNYHMTLWVKNEGCNFIIKFGGVSISEANMITVADQTSISNGWQLIEHDYYLTDDYSRLRFEINITSPGKIRFDGLSIVGN